MKKQDTANYVKNKSLAASALTEAEGQPLNHVLNCRSSSILMRSSLRCGATFIRNKYRFSYRNSGLTAGKLPEAIGSRERPGDEQRTSTLKELGTAELRLDIFSELRSENPESAAASQNRETAPGGIRFVRSHPDENQQNRPAQNTNALSISGGCEQAFDILGIGDDKASSTVWVISNICGDLIK